MHLLLLGGIRVTNGRRTHTIPCVGTRDQRYSLELTVGESGWFLIRGIAGNQKTFRFASTAPFYFEIGSVSKRISKSSSSFFLDWVNERIDRVRTNISDKAEEAEVLRYHWEAREFWKNKIQQANVE